MTDTRKCDSTAAFENRLYSIPCKCLANRCEGCQHHVDDRLSGVHHCKATYAHVEPPADCARDEITEWVASFYAGDDLDAAVTFLLGWANRRAANVIGHTVEALAWIKNEAGFYDGVAEIDRLAFAAHQALRFVGPVSEKVGGALAAR